MIAGGLGFFRAVHSRARRRPICVVRAPITPDKIGAIYLPNVGDAITRLRPSAFPPAIQRRTRSKRMRAEESGEKGTDCERVKRGKETIHGPGEIRHIGNKNLMAMQRYGQCYFAMERKTRIPLATRRGLLAIFSAIL